MIVLKRTRHYLKNVARAVVAGQTACTVCGNPVVEPTRVVRLISGGTHVAHYYECVSLESTWVPVCDMCVGAYPELKEFVEAL